MLAEKRATTHSADDHLVRRAQAGEAAAFDRLFAEHKDGVYACLWHLLEGDADVVEEAVGSVFLSAYRGLVRFRGDASFSTWLYRIAVNEAHARCRQKCRSPLGTSVPLEEDTAGLPPQPADPAAEVTTADEQQRLWRAVGALPEPYRTPTVLCYMSGMASREIGQVLKRPAGTVRYQLSRALQILRERLGSEWLE